MVDPVNPARRAQEASMVAGTVKMELLVAMD
jgi:hypothetical protein